MDELVVKLSQGNHPVEISLRPNKTATALKKRIDEFGFVHIRFTDTQGGTEIGFKLDKQESHWALADFKSATGQIKLAGSLRLNYVPVKCIAEIDLATLSGVGRLQILDFAKHAK